MAVAMFDGKDICFTAFSGDEASESLAFYNWLQENYQPKSVSTLYWGGTEIKSAIPDGIKAIEIEGPTSISHDNFLGINTIVRHPVTRPDLLPQDRDITSMTNEFIERCPAQIIGVTGTKGKGTTVTLIAKILEAVGYRTHLVGNIGKPALEVLKNINENDLVVFELSSFQLWDLKKSPHIAVVLMIVAEHMDVHKDMREYVDAKLQITANQEDKDVVIYHPDNEFSKHIASKSPGKKLRFQTGEGAQVVDGNIMVDGKVLMAITEVGLLGEHNLDNICAAITAVMQYTNDFAAIKNVVTEFQGLEHRLEFLGLVKDVSYFNDSFATAPQPTMAAIKAIDVPKVLILGGSSKGANFNELARAIKQANIRAVITIGKEGPNIAEAIKLAGVEGFLLVEAETAQSMSEIVSQASLVAKAGDAVLLSPACASFDMFKNYKVRGQDFKTAVEALASR